MSAGSVVYTLFFNNAVQNEIKVTVKTKVLSVSGLINKVHSDGIFLFDRDGLMYAIPFVEIVLASECLDKYD